MSLRFCRLLTLALLLSALAACGDDDVTPPPDTDGGTTDAALRDGGTGVDGGDARSDAGDCRDEDDDRHGALPCGDDCDDTDATRFPGNTETCDGDDEDCNDSTFGPDGDADGFPAVTCCNGAGNCGTDCNDALDAVNPGAAERCNGGVDDDCDGLADAADGVCVSCPSGYRGVDLDCENIVECAEFAPCGAAVGTTCTDTPGSYTCTCPTGYGAPTTGGTCADVNECTAGTDDCTDAPAGICTDTVGSFTCACPPDVGGTGRGPSGCAGPRFTDLGDGTVRDNNGSGFVWQQGFSPDNQNQAASITYCTSLAFDGGGWRLPTKDELLSIVDTRFSPTIDPLFFPGTPSYFWSSSPVAGSPSGGWLVYFNGGYAGNRDASNVGRARCVR